MSTSLTHLDADGSARMVDVSDKPVTLRTARAESRVVMSTETAEAIRQNQVTKGQVLEVARLAGIMAAKRTGELIPLCHPLGLDGVEVHLRFLDATTLVIEAEARVHGRTGVEMEALTAVTVAGLTVYDMCKALDRQMTLGPTRLLSKSGGRSGSFSAAPLP